MGSTLDIPVPATSQLIGTDCIPTAIIRRRHQKFHTDAKRVRFHIRGLIPGHNATVLRLYSDDKESFWLYSDSNYARTVFRLQLSDFEYSRNTVPKLDRSAPIFYVYSTDAVVCNQTAAPSIRALPAYFDCRQIVGNNNKRWAKYIVVLVFAIENGI